MKDLNEFLAYAVRLEEETALRFSDLTEAMKTYGNREVAEFFGRMTENARLHLAEARRRAAFHEVPALAPGDFVWPGDESPEATSMEASHYLMTVDYALALALDGERRGFTFYDQLARTTEDPEIRMMAAEFAAEEAEHVAELERWAARYPKATA